MDDLMDGDLWKRRQVVKKNGMWTVEGRPLNTVSELKRWEPPNIPSMSIVNLLVTLPPKAATPPHTHNGAALTATVLRGSTLNQMIHPGIKENADGKSEVVEMDSGVRLLKAGQTWYEPPGCHHVRSENPSDTEEAVFVVNFVIETAKLDAAEKEGNIARALVILDADKPQL